MFAVGAFVSACGGSRVPLDKMRDDSRAYYWVGKSFAGLELTYAETYQGRFATLIYGTCEPPSDGGCAPPLEIQNVRCTSGSVTVTIFGRARLAARAEKALRPLNEAARNADTPIVSFDRSMLC